MPQRHCPIDTFGLPQTTLVGSRHRCHTAQQLLGKPADGGGVEPGPLGDIRQLQARLGQQAGQDLAVRVADAQLCVGAVEEPVEAPVRRRDRKPEAVANKVHFAPEL